MKPRQLPSSTHRGKRIIPICMEEKFNNLTDVQVQPSLFKPKSNLIKKRRRFESMKKLLDTNQTPWSHQFRLDQEIVPQKQKNPSWRAKSAISGDIYGKFEVSSSVMERAEAVQANLDAKFPSFIKPMIRSNVTRGFWLSLPILFCKLHLPKYDSTVCLVDESQRVYNTRFLVERNGLSAGWRGFSIAHDLVEGDVLVFHLVGTCKMKVYIVRANHLGEVDAALGLLHLDAQARKMDSAEQPNKDYRHLKQSRQKCLYPCQQEVPSEQVKDEDAPGDLSLSLEGKLSQARWFELGVGLISEILSIAEAVKANKVVVSPKDFTGWKKQPICFEDLHDSLGRIQARLDHLVSCILESNEPVYRRHGRGADDNWDHEEEMSTFEVKMLELKEATERLNAEIEVLKIRKALGS